MNTTEFMGHNFINSSKSESKEYRGEENKDKENEKGSCWVGVGVSENEWEWVGRVWRESLGVIRTQKHNACEHEVSRGAGTDFEGWRRHNQPHRGEQRATRTNDFFHDLLGL